MADSSAAGAPKREQVSSEEHYHIPAGTTYLLGTIQGSRADFITKAPVFDLVVLDPPWPNRSARRKKDNYSVAADLRSVRELLSSIPLASKLAPDALVAVWVTGKPAITEMLTGPNGVFREWGVELVTDWTWLKVGVHGNPIFDVESQWRKPWERLLIARKIGSRGALSRRGKVVVRGA